MLANCKKLVQFVLAIATLMCAIAIPANANYHPKTDHGKVQCYDVYQAPFSFAPCNNKVPDKNKKPGDDDNDKQCPPNSMRTYPTNDNNVSNDVSYNDDNPGDDENDNNKVPDKNKKPGDDDNDNEHKCPLPVVTPPVAPVPPAVPATPAAPITPVMPPTQQPAPNGAPAPPAIQLKTITQVFCITDGELHLGSRNMQVFGRQTVRVNGSLVASKHVRRAHSSISMHFNLPASARNSIGKFSLRVNATYRDHQGQIHRIHHPAVSYARCARHRAPQRQFYMTNAPTHGPRPVQVKTLPFGTPFPIRVSA